MFIIKVPIYTSIPLNETHRYVVRGLIKPRGFVRPTLQYSKRIFFISMPRTRFKVEEFGSESSLLIFCTISLHASLFFYQLTSYTEHIWIYPLLRGVTHHKSFSIRLGMRQNFVFGREIKQRNRDERNWWKFYCNFKNITLLTCTLMYVTGITLDKRNPSRWSDINASTFTPVTSQGNYDKWGHDDVKSVVESSEINFVRRKQDTMSISSRDFWNVFQIFSIYR